jgi:(R)-2-hydroxyacyl-CoA dehydratese activating ATPase
MISPPRYLDPCSLCQCPEVFMITAGVDVGSTATKVVVSDGSVLGEALLPTGWNPWEAGLQALGSALQQAGVAQGDLRAVVGTGYGRVSLPFIDRKATEVACHARGARFLIPPTRLVIDIGGQDSKIIALNAEGSVIDFLMNDKCAAGTGRFLQAVTGVLDLSLDDLGELALGCQPAPVSSMCAVFAESEVIGLLSRGVSKGAIAAGVIESIARRIQSLARRMPPADEITFSGGLAKNRAVCLRLSEALGRPLQVPESPQMVGALGAALIGFYG